MMVASSSMSTKGSDRRSSRTRKSSMSSMSGRTVGKGLERVGVEVISSGRSARSASGTWSRKRSSRHARRCRGKSSRPQVSVV